MRPQLFVGGLLAVLLGVLFYAVPLPLVFFSSIPFVIGGGIMALASFFMSEGPGPIPPPEGSRFCVFCSTPVPVGSERCPHCNGLQPREGD